MCVSVYVCVLCVCARACVCVCVRVPVYVCMCGSLRSALNAFTRSLSAFVLETGFLIEPVVFVVSAGLACRETLGTPGLCLLSHIGIASM